jgi:hypothetical protein
MCRVVFGPVSVYWRGIAMTEGTGTVWHLEAVKADLVARQYPAGVSAANPAGPLPHVSS